ncbi:DNA-binding protein [Streptococcus pneumoniae]|nr:DNA-binding protein [Streptococcus pneumoniae]
MNALEKVKQWFIDRDLENGGRLDKQSLVVIAVYLIYGGSEDEY